MNVEQFRSYVRHAFSFLVDEFGFAEAELPMGRYVNKYMVCFSNGITWIGVEGTNYGFGIDVILQSHDWSRMPTPAYSLSELLTLRVRGYASIRAKSMDTRDIQKAQNDQYATALREYAGDVLRGDFSVFLELDEAHQVHDKTQRKIERESLQIHEDLRWMYMGISRKTEEFCGVYRDVEYATICRRIAKELCQIEESPLISGRDATWACGIVHAMCSVNDLFDESHSKHVSVGEIAEYYHLAVTTMRAKSKQICQVLKMTSKESKWLHRPIRRSAI